MAMRTEYALYAITNTDPNNQEREFVTEFCEVIEDNEVEELVETFVPSEIKRRAYYYVIEKQYYFN